MAEPENIEDGWQRIMGIFAMGKAKWYAESVLPDLKAAAFEVGAGSRSSSMTIISSGYVSRREPTRKMAQRLMSLEDITLCCRMSSGTWKKRIMGSQAS